MLPQLADRHAKGQHPKYIRGISWAVDRVFNSKADIRYPFPKMPELDILPLEVTPTTTLGPIIAEEGSITKCLKIYIFLRQLSLDEEKDFFTRLLGTN